MYCPMRGCDVAEVVAEVFRRGLFEALPASPDGPRVTREFRHPLRKRRERAQGKDVTSLVRSY